MAKPHTIRAPAVAGRFYPAEPARLSRMVAQCLGGCPSAETPLRAVVSPHAGYAFSGALTARALAASRSAAPDLLVVLSPSHKHAFDGIALPSQERLAIPGAEIPVAQATRDALIARGLAKIEDAAHDREHGIEVQLPFLHAVHPGVPVLPLVIGRAQVPDVARVIDAVAEGAMRPLFILSSDLSHFLPRAAADQADATTARRFETGATDLGPRDACGAMALNGYLASQQGAGGRILRLGMTNSAVLTGEDSRTVGYGAWALSPAEAACLSSDMRARLLDTARRVLASRLSRGRAPHVELASFPPELQTYAASFVTLERGGRLRGCIGSLMAHRPMIEDVAVNAQKAALDDPRFRPLTADDLPEIRLKIALLSPPRRIAVAAQRALEDRLQPGRDGLILRDGGHAGVFLPQVWSQLPEPRAFVQALKRKAGLPPEHWSARVRLEVFHAESFGEDQARA